MKKLFLLLFIFFCCLSPVLSQSTANSDGDFQFWYDTQLIIPLIKRKSASGETIEKLSFYLNGNIRFEKNISRLFDERIGFGFDYRYNKYLTFTKSYLYIAQQPAGRKQYESRLRFAVSPRKSWKNLFVDDRNMVEYRFRNNNADSVRYRNKLRFLYPVKKDKKEIIVPFAANEIFYDFRSKTFSRNEFSVGLSRKLISNVGADFFYLLQTNKSVSPKQQNVFGVNLKIKID